MYDVINPDKGNGCAYKSTKFDAFHFEQQNSIIRYTNHYIAQPFSFGRDLKRSEYFKAKAINVSKIILYLPICQTIILKRFLCES